MLIKKFNDCQEIIAGDSTILRELLSGLNDPADVRYSLAHAKLLPGKQSLKHALKTSEVYYIITGLGRMHIGEEISEVGSRDTVYIPPQAVQYIENIGDTELEFICIVDPAWRVENEIVVSSIKYQV